MPRNALNMKWYQDAVVNGKKMPFRRSRKDTTTLRWRGFIEPLVTDGSTFVDIGCNAGFCCRKMVDKGFISFGVEKDSAFFDCARYWENQEPKGVRLVNGDIHGYDMPCADIVLMAYVHYWQTHEQLVELEKKLRRKAVNVILVTRYTHNKKYKSPVYKEYLIGLFRRWDLTGEISGQNYTSVRFTNRELFSVPVSGVLYDPRFRPRNERNGFAFQNAFRDFVKKVASGEPFDPKQTLNFKYIKSEETLRRTSDAVISSQMKWVKDVLENGIKEPCSVVKKPGKKPYLRDGNHRKVIAETIGMEHLVCRQI